jgi:hypothetical protein
MPRALSSDQQSRISTKLSRFNKRFFDIASPQDEPDAGPLIDMIETALQTAGWEEIAWEGGNTFLTRPGKPALGGSPTRGGITIITGIVVQVQKSENLEAATELASALLDEGIDARVQSTLVVPNNNENAVHLIVGKRI